jgi:adenine-specific DNA-methyltransferase
MLVHRHRLQRRKLLRPPHAYFLGAGDPYKALKAEIDEEAWSSFNSNVSWPFAKPSTGRIAVNVINHLGDEVMKVFGARR